MLYEATLHLEAPKQEVALKVSEARPPKQLRTMASGVSSAGQLSFRNLFRFCVRGAKVKRLSRSEATEKPLSCRETGCRQIDAFEIERSS